MLFYDLNSLAPKVLDFFGEVQEEFYSRGNLGALFPLHGIIRSVDTHPRIDCNLLT